ncbi:MAG: metallophosphoesterase [Candidatus Zixiibacteriota bacterium]
MSFFLVVILVLSLMYGYVGWRFIVPAAFSTPVNILVWGLLIVLLVLPFMPVVFRFNNIEGEWTNIIAWIGYLSFGFFTLLFAIVFLRDVAYALITIVQKTVEFSSHLIGAGAASAKAIDPLRRALVMNSVNAGLLAVTGGLMAYGMYEALRKPAIVELTIPIKNLPKDLEGLRIVQITDIHVSQTIRRPFVQYVVETVNSLKPDLVALTGDLVDGSVEQLGHDTAPLADLKAPHGMFFITGNHEYYSGVEQWVEETARLGFTVLLNEHRIVQRGEGQLILAGVTDYSGGQFSPSHLSDPHKAITGAPVNLPRILLAHQPKSIFESSKAGYDYVISGHTHGGQYEPYHFLTRMSQPYLSGLHDFNGTRIYVSRGTGYWGPQIRIGARSEITVHTLVGA